MSLIQRQATKPKEEQMELQTYPDTTIEIKLLHGDKVITEYVSNAEDKGYVTGIYQQIKGQLTEEIK